METFYLTTPKNKNIKTKWGDIKIFLSFFSLDVLYFLRQQAKMHSLQLGTFYVHILELCLYERQTIAHFHIKNSGTLTFFRQINGYLRKSRTLSKNHQHFIYFDNFFNSEN